MKKILLLGGSAQQVVAIKKAKELGYFTILCDYLADNPGQYVADKFYQISTTDREAVLELAIREKIKGIVAYASDPAAPTAAYVAEQMGLPTNPYASVEILGEKHKFREFLQKNNFNCPRSGSFTSYDGVEDLIREFQFPVMVKPTDSSGSKGITKVEDVSELSQAFKYAQGFSRNKVIVIEEYIQRSNEFVIGGDIFVLDGKIVFWGLLNCHRDENVNPLVPVGKSSSVLVSREQMMIIKETEQRLMNLLNIKFGAFNVEMIFDKNNQLYIIENGPRNGGNMIPDLLKMIYGFDMIEATIRCAMGDFAIPLSFNENGFYATHNLHSAQNGILRDISFSKRLRKHIVDQKIYVKPGDEIFYFDGANKALGIIFLKFDDEKTMHDILNNINDEIEILVDQAI